MLPVVLACGTSLAFDRLMEHAGLTPPNFRVEAEDLSPGRHRAALLRSAALVLMALVLWLAVFAPLAMLGEPMPTDTSSLTVPQLFSLHMVFIVTLALWYLLGFAGSSPSLMLGWLEQFGFRATEIPREIGIGLVAGVVAWFGVICSLLVAALVIYFVGGEEALPTQPPEMIGWLVALPIGIRLALSLSAGVVEETFFRGFLQPRAGIALSTVLFVLAHLSYGQPLLLLGVCLLSLFFAQLVRWRQSIWAAIVAHAVFDAIQLLIVIPAAMKFVDSPAVGPVALMLAWAAKL